MLLIPVNKLSMTFYFITSSNSTLRSPYVLHTPPTAGLTNAFGLYFYYEVRTSCLSCSSEQLRPPVSCTLVHCVTFCHLIPECCLTFWSFFLQTWILPLPFWKYLPSWTDWWFWHFATSAHCKPCFWVNKYQYCTSSALSGLSTFLPPLCTPDSREKSSGFGIKFGNRTLTFNLGPDSQFIAFFFNSSASYQTLI